MMQPNQLSSGDVTADRRADYARMLDEGGEPASAAELMEQALELTPGWPAGWFSLGLYRTKAGDLAGAISAFRQVLPLDHDDLFGAPLMLASLGAAPVPDQPSSLYVERLFNDYAGRFDHALTTKLAYGVPGELAALLAETGGLPQRYRLAADLGCGTGLVGEAIRARCDRLEGFDLSANMLAKADEKKIYDRLAIADLSMLHGRSGLFAPDLAAHRADLILAADVFIYLGKLDIFFTLAKALAAPGAVLAFSVEDAGEGADVRLASSLRYAHSKRYLRDICRAHDMVIRAERDTVVRLEAGRPIPGLLFVAQNAD